MLTALMIAGTTHAYMLKYNSSGSEMRWPQGAIPFRINTDGDHGLSPERIESVAELAAAQYEGVSGAELNFDYRGRTQNAARALDNVNAIFFDEDWQEDPDLLMITDVYSEADGTIVEFDIAINATHHWWSTDGDEESNDLLNTLTHELGHAVGLDHSTDEEASMFGTTDEGELIKRDLHNDDRQALRYLYSADGEAAQGCATVRAGPTPVLGVFGLLLCMGLVRRDD